MTVDEIKNGIVIQQYKDDEGVIPEEELCKCCGEQRRDKSFGENYDENNGGIRHTGGNN